MSTLVVTDVCIVSVSLAMATAFERFGVDKRRRINQFKSANSRHKATYHSAGVVRPLMRRPIAGEVTGGDTSMRMAFIATLLVLVPIASRAQDFLPPIFLSPKFIAPTDAPSSIVIAGQHEPGERLIVTGQVTAGGKPLAGVSIYAFHADAEGLYTKDGSNSDENARLHGALRTDANGRYRYETIRPRGYGTNPGHLHHVASAPGYKTRLRDFWFADDPLTMQQCKPGDTGSYCALVGAITRDADGVWHVTHNFEMIPE